MYIFNVAFTLLENSRLREADVRWRELARRGWGSIDGLWQRVLGAAAAAGMDGGSVGAGAPGALRAGGCSVAALVCMAFGHRPSGAGRTEPCGKVGVQGSLSRE